MDPRTEKLGCVAKEGNSYITKPRIADVRPRVIKVLPRQ